MSTMPPSASTASSAATTPAVTDRGAGSTRFLLTLGAWFVALFGLMRLRWVEDNLLTPLAQVQQRVADQLTGSPSDLVYADASCSAADPMALCVGAMLAYPAAWGARLRGAALGLLVIVLLNVVRLGNLSLVVEADMGLFRLLHDYVWPGALILASAACVFAWMKRQETPVPAGGTAGGFLPGGALRRFLFAATALVVLYFATAPFFYEHPAVDVIAERIARTAGAMLAAAGTEVQAHSGIVWTDHGTFIVTQECIFTPLIPLYLAAALCAPVGWRRRGLALAATPFLFFGLGVARLLVLMVPAAVIGSYATAIHAFSQTLVALVLVGVAAVCGAGSAGAGSAAARALLATSVGVAAALAGVPLWHGVLGNAAAGLQALAGHAGHTFADGQGAWALAPAFQIGLFTALWIARAGRARWPRALLGIGTLALTQALLAIPVGELSAHYGFDPHPGLIRGWTLGGPVALVWLLAGPVPAGTAEAATEGIRAGGWAGIRPPTGPQDAAASGVE